MIGRCVILSEACINSSPCRVSFHGSFRADMFASVR